MQWEFHEKMFEEEELRGMIVEAIKAHDLPQTAAALPLAEKLHAGQKRKGDGNIPYIYHPLLVACHALSLGLCDDDIVAAALLHDVVEDCGVEPDELPVSAETRRAVSLLTFRVEEGETKEAAKKRYYQAIAENRIASIVKALDRCNNISSMASAFSRERIVRYIEETETYIMPVLTRLEQQYPADSRTAFLLQYHMRSVLESLKRLV